MQAETRLARILLAASRAPHRDHPQPTGSCNMLDPSRISRDAGTGELTIKGTPPTW
jgi:hypothetical protein